VPTVIKGVQKLVVEVENQDRALRFWTDAVGFELAQDVSYGEERWLEVRTPDESTILVLVIRQGEPPVGPRGAADLEYLLLLRRLVTHV
jgi:hypothetical protein